MITVYRKINNIQEVVMQLSDNNAMFRRAIMGVDEVSVSIVSDSVLNVQVGDYIIYENTTYTINRDADFRKISDVQYSYDFIFESPLYTLLDKLFVHKMTRETTFTLTGKLADFVALLVWNVNKATDNPLGVDVGWTVGSIIDTDYKNLVFDTNNCRDVLSKLASDFGCEFYLNEKQINFTSKIENETDYVFEHGAGKGLYEISQQNVDKDDTVTRVYVRGGNKNIPNAAADESGYLKLPEDYLENFSEHSKVVERKVIFEDIYPHFVGKVASVYSEYNKEVVCPQIDFDLQAIAVGDNARINFLTGDLMGVSFKFQWDNSAKKVTLIPQDDETALANSNGVKPTIPNTYRKAKTNDTFNFTGVLMPQSYVDAAIAKLRQKGVEWLAYFSHKRVKFDLNIDHRYMRGKPNLHCGDLIRINIPEKQINKLLRIVQLEKNLKTGKINATVSNYLDEKWEKRIEGAISAIKTSVNSGMMMPKEVDIVESYDSRNPSEWNVFSALRSLLEIKKNAISRLQSDTAAEIIKFIKGLEIGNFTSGALGGGGAFRMNNGVSELEVDKLNVRMVATFFELVLSKLRHVGGQIILSPAQIKCTKVVDGGSYYRCYFNTGENNEVTNEFVAGDQARCQTFSGSGAKFYWRLVTSVGPDYINLSKTDTLGEGIPAASDDIVQLGHRTNVERQNAQILSTVGADAPSYKQYAGINSFSLEGKELNVISSKGNKFVGITKFLAGSSGLTNLAEWAGAAQDIQNAQSAANAADLKAQQAIANAQANVADYNAKFDVVQAQLDGEVSNWFYAYTPTLSNYPANAWTTNAERDRHIGDTFTNTEVYPATNAGKSWRYVKNSGVYSWQPIADSDAVKALQQAAKAQATADGKSTTYLIQPTKYHLGDMWILNADRTLNGIAYKSGDQLTAQQDSDVFAEAHWRKAVRYTGDEAVENLKIGGRNMLRNSANFKNIKHWSSNGGVYAYNNKIYIPSGYYLYQYVDVQQAEQYTLSADMLTWRPTDSSVTLNYYNASNQLISNQIFLLSEFGFLYGAFKKGVKTISLPLDCAKVMILVASANDDIIALNYTQFEKGNKATDYSEAPEDVQDRIAQSKADAEAAAKAYSDAKQVETQAYADLKKTEANAYADGKVTDEEQRAIADAQAKYNSAKALADAAQNAANAAQQTANNAQTTASNALNKATAVEATANKSKAITDKFGTTVDGGLIQSVMMLLRDLNSQAETAGISGIQGDGSKPAFWSGGTYAEALAGLANIILYHNSRAKIGVFRVGEDGKVRVMDVTTADLVRLLISQENLPSITSLLNDATQTASVSIFNYTVSDAGVNTHLFDEVLTVVQNDSKITLTGVMKLTCVMDNIPVSGGITLMTGTSCSVEIYKKNASNVYEVYASGSYAYTENYKEENFNIVLQNVPAGDYKMGILYSISPEGSVSIQNLSMTYVHNNDVRRIEFGKDGFMSFFNYNGQKSYIHATEDKGIVIGGKTDIPGVLATGSVDSYGGHSNVWGAKAATPQQMITKGNGAGQITGIYNIPHNINHKRYTAFATSASDDVDARVIVKAENYIRVHVKSVTGAFVNAGFDYLISGTNY